MKHQIVFSICSLLILMGIGVVVYQNLEGWRPLDTIYFSTITFATVGYGDIHPVTDNGKLFTIFYIIFGVGLMLFTLTTLGTHWVENRIKIIGRLVQSPLDKLKGINNNGKLSDKIIDGILFDRKK